MLLHSYNLQHYTSSLSNLKSIGEIISPFVGNGRIDSLDQLKILCVCVFSKHYSGFIHTTAIDLFNSCAYDYTYIEFPSRYFYYLNFYESCESSFCGGEYCIAFFPFVCFDSCLQKIKTLLHYTGLFVQGFHVPCITFYFRCFCILVFIYY